MATKNPCDLQVGEVAPLNSAESRDLFDPVTRPLAKSDLGQVVYRVTGY